jgi:hypothetical protein
MNNVDKNPDYKGLYQTVKKKFDQTMHFNYGSFAGDRSRC